MKFPKRHWRLLLPALATVAALAGCAENMPQPDPSEAWVALREEPTTTLMAEEIDGKRLNDGRFSRFQQENTGLRPASTSRVKVTVTVACVVLT